MKKIRTRFNVHKITEVYNLPKVICEHMVGPEHNHVHRMGVGVVVMSCGILISKCFPEIYVLHLICDGIGYMVHGIGAIPFVNYLISGTSNENESNGTED